MYVRVECPVGGGDRSYRARHRATAIAADPAFSDLSANLPRHETSVDDPSLAATPVAKAALKRAVVGTIDIRKKCECISAMPALRGGLESPW